MGQDDLSANDPQSYDVPVVARFFITLVVGITAVLLWSIVATLLMRLLGARLPLLPFTKSGKSEIQLLTFSQSVWYGVLFNGCEMFIAMTLFEYAWRYWHAPSKDFSLRIFYYAITWPAYGLFRGFTLANENKNRRTSAELSKQGLKEISDWDENGFSR